MFSALSAVKFAVSGVVGLGTGKIVSGIIKNNVSPENLIDKVSIVAATWTLSGVATTATKKYTNQMIDETYTAINTLVGDLKEKSKLGRINRGETTFEDEGLDPAAYDKDDSGMWVKLDEPLPGETTAAA